MIVVALFALTLATHVTSAVGRSWWAVGAQGGLMGLYAVGLVLGAIMVSTLQHWRLQRVAGSAWVLLGVLALAVAGPAGIGAAVSLVVLGAAYAWGPRLASVVSLAVLGLVIGGLGSLSGLIHTAIPGTGSSAGIERLLGALGVLVLVIGALLVTWRREGWLGWGVRDWGLNLWHKWRGHTTTPGRNLQR